MPSKVKGLLLTRDQSAESQHEDIDTLPLDWPKDVVFLRDHTFSDTVTAEMRSDLSRTTNESTTWSKVPSSSIQVPCVVATGRIIANPKHPACGQRGLFAAQQLEPDSFICLYLGHVHTNSLSDTDAHSDYDLSYDRELGLSIDAARSGNEARFANDYRGITDRANAEFRDCFVQVPSEKRIGGTKWERRVGIFVLSAGKAGLRKKGIREGEEVLVSYGKGFWEGRKSLAGMKEG